MTLGRGIQRMSAVKTKNLIAYGTRFLKFIVKGSKVNYYEFSEKRDVELHPPVCTHMRIGAGLRARLNDSQLKQTLKSHTLEKLCGDNTIRPHSS